MTMENVSSIFNIQIIKIWVYFEGYKCFKLANVVVACGLKVQLTKWHNGLGFNVLLAYLGSKRANVY